MLKLGPLLSIDNHARRAAENEFERLRRENPTVVAGALITTLNQAGGANEAERELAAVLARRVIRLLLAGTAPSRLLCLTFTKAAAAEMATRVFDTLGAWTALDDEALAAEIEAIEGRRPGAARLSLARHLFATALETSRLAEAQVAERKSGRRRTVVINAVLRSRHVSERR